ncbi:MAG TPA: hypothetical protein VF247_11665 [Candidatus Krumholzibacteria bacterium]
MINRAVSRTGSTALLVAALAVLWSGQAAAQLPARAFAIPPEVHMASGSALWCVYVEPVNGDFDITSVDPCTVQLICNCGGSASAITYNCTKPAVVGDGDNNGIQDIQLCFQKTAMAALFDGMHGRKPKTVTLGVNGHLVTGGIFTGSVTVQVYLLD